MGCKVSDSFCGPRCGNWKGVAKVSYEDIIQLEESFTEKGDLFSVISVSGNGDVLRDADYTRKDEMEDERVELLLDRIKKNFDWSNTEWPVIEDEETEMEEADTESEADKSVDATDIAADVETSSVHVAGRGKRKIQDEGAESRKKKLLCKRTAEKKQSIDQETKSFIEGLVHSSISSLGDILRAQMASMESMFKERIGNMEIEVSQLREAISLRAEGSVPKSKTDEAAPKTKTAQAPAKKKVNQAQAQAPAKEKDWLKNVKVENSKPFNMSPPELNDEEIDRAGEASADAALVYLRKEDWEKPLRIGPSLLDAEIGTALWIEPSGFTTRAVRQRVLPPHGQTQEIWNVDVDRLYVPVHVSGIIGSHCVSVSRTRSIDVFDCSGRKRYKELDGFANLVPRIVKAVQPPKLPKDFTFAAYTVHYVPMGT
ncbi:hypothetical protein Bca52824_081830 [Brassica carinata]|uniref:Uncharacterized protein n=1 Tax=Brassica carinata TaxID=52824 RepID=A0A8X7PLA3_BRACI|nr:hypothetical protein Bca52824_081830 [Brassica carinata]